MANELFKRFVNEVMKEPELYDYYLRNPWVVQERFNDFYHQQEKNNKKYAKIIEKYHLVKTSDYILETILSENINNVSNFLKNKNKIQIKSSYGTIKVADELMVSLTGNICYISNGIYQNTRQIINDIITYPYGPTIPSFIVGVVAKPNWENNNKINTVFFEENLKRAKQLQKEFHNKKIPITVHKESKTECSAYLLIHRGDRI